MELNIIPISQPLILCLIDKINNEWDKTANPDKIGSAEDEIDWTQGYGAAYAHF